MTIKEIADMCNVSSATVSNVINGKKKVGSENAKKILKVIEEVGYQPNAFARGLRTQSTRTLGVIVEDISIFSSPEIINGIMHCCEANDYHIVLINMHLYDRWHGSWFTDQHRYMSELEPVMKQLDALNVDGILYVAGHARRVIELRQKRERPIVMAYAYPADDNIPTVIIDDEKGAYDMTKYLISAGHRRIGVMAGERDNMHTLARMEGYRLALFEEEILYDPNLVEYGRWERESSYANADKLMRQDVTAFLCFSDAIASGVYDYMREHGVCIGKDVSVAGYDNQEMSDYLYPRLTTMQLPLREIGFAAADRLIKILENGEIGQQEEIKMPCTLIERESVKRVAIETRDGTNATDARHERQKYEDERLPVK